MNHTKRIPGDVKVINEEFAQTPTGDTLTLTVRSYFTDLYDNGQAYDGHTDQSYVITDPKEIRAYLRSTRGNE